MSGMGRTEKKILGKNAAKIIEVLKRAYCDELTHAELLTDRISELGDRAPSNPAEWAKYSSIGPLGRAKYLTRRAALERAMHFGGKAVENYNNLAKKALALGDYVTYNLATTILTHEVKDEQNTEDILKSLEVK